MSRRNDEQFGDGAGTRASRRQRVPSEANLQAKQTRNLPQGEEGLGEVFYRDEHPEIPITRRASLYSDSNPSSSRPSTTRASGTETGHARRVPPTQKRGKSYTSRSGSGSRMRPQPRPQRSILSPFPFLPQFVQRQNRFPIGAFTVSLVIVLVVIGALLHSFISQVPGVILIPGFVSDNTTSTNPHALIPGDHPAPPVYAQAAYLLDADTGATLYAHNPSMHLPIMSTTKLMTALLAVEHGNLDQTVTINDQITNDINQLPPDSSNVGLKSGESYTLRELMYGLLLASGNDAAIAIADTIGGSYSNFVTMMNQEVATLGLHDSHFTNPHGLQEPNHYSSAHDMAIIGLHSLGNPLVHQISGTLNYHIDATPQHPAHDFFNGNQFIWWYPGVDAGKPGYDAATNFVQVVSCVRNGHHLIGVTIHTIDWWTDMRDLMNWGFDTYTWVSPHDLNTPTHPIPYADLWNNFASDKKEDTIPTVDHGRYYIYTGYSITGDIENYFDKNGGLTTFGFPLSPSGSVGQNIFSQRFEHGTIRCNSQSRQCQKGT